MEAAKRALADGDAARLAVRSHSLILDTAGAVMLRRFPQALERMRGVSSDAARASQNDCAMCMDARRTDACVPCGHKCACAECGRRLVGQPCPVCRRPVTAMMKIFD